MRAKAAVKSMSRKVARSIGEARETAEHEVNERRQKVQELTGRSFPEIDKALKVHSDNGEVSRTGRAGYASHRHFPRQRKYTAKEAGKILNKK